MKWECYATVAGTKYLGEVEAESATEAEDKAARLPTYGVALCPQCSEQIGAIEIIQVIAQPAL